MEIQRSNRVRFNKGVLKTAILAGALMALLGCQSNTAATSPSNNGAANMQLQLTQEWDKIFPRSGKVEQRKVKFTNRYGITLAADLYLPKNRSGEPLPAIEVSSPFGAVKEQSSGLYAQTMAERGFVTLAFDPS